MSEKISLDSSGLENKKWYKKHSSTANRKK